jgi:hypothetical protein
VRDLLDNQVGLAPAVDIRPGAIEELAKNRVERLETSGTVMPRQQVERVQVSVPTFFSEPIFSFLV